MGSSQIYNHYREENNIGDEIDNHVCWFCEKGRHNDCMKNIPIHERTDGPHDCTFGTELIPCKCKYCN